MGWLEHPPTLEIPKDESSSTTIAHKVALESITLLKNDGNALPLDPFKLCTLAVIGPNGDKPVIGGGGSAQVTPTSAISLVDALTAALPRSAKCPGVVYSRGLPTSEDIFHATTFAHGVSEELFASPDMTGSPTRQTRDNLERAATQPTTHVKSGRWTADYTPQETGPILIFVALGKQDSVQLTANGKQVLSIIRPEGRPIISATVDAVANQPLHLVLNCRKTPMA
jgi:beta-glucosidase